MESSDPSAADLIDLGGGDYSLSLDNFGLEGGLVLRMPPSGNIQVVATSSTLNQSGVAVINNQVAEVAGSYIWETETGVLLVGGTRVPGVCVIIVDGKVYARVALHTSSFTVEDCFAMKMPLYAYREGESVQPITIVGHVAGWSIYSPNAPTRVVGYNLPTSLRYNSSVTPGEFDLTAEGGDYGIEFTTPNDAARVIVFDAGFWLFFDNR